MIVDDEPWVITSLVHGMSWEKAGFEIVATATDGEEALSKMKKQRPDVLVTDIRMPVMDGLELIKKARTDLPYLKFIIISGHAEFEYARRAMAYGVANYCLKPVEKDEMDQTLQAIKTELDQALDQRMSLIQTYIEREDKEGCLRFFKQIGFNWSETDQIRVVSGPTDNAFLLDRRHQLYLISEPQFGFMKNQPQLSSVGVSRLTSNPLRLDKAVNEALIARAQSFITGHPALYVYQRPDLIPLRMKLGEVRGAISSQNINTASQMLDELKSIILNRGYQVNQVYYCYARILDMIEENEAPEKQAEDDPVSYLETWQELTSLFSHIDDMFQSLKQQLSESINRDNDSCGLEVTGSLIDSIVRYLETHYSEDIRLSKLAEKYHITNSHLCRCFKQKTGTTFTAYLVDVRLQKAKQLLTSTSLHISEIAENCGFDNYFYFARLFKRKAGLTPTQYRDLKDENESQ